MSPAIPIASLSGSILLAVLLLTGIGCAPLLSPPLEPVSVESLPRETRGVWYTTVLGLDGFPNPAQSPAQQEQTLRLAVQAAHALGINTFVMQVIRRGEALYPSARMPWSARFVRPGGVPPFDPLAVALEESRRLGMEFHAWVNVFHVGSEIGAQAITATHSLEARPAHVALARPEWVIAVGRDYWIDPAIPEARTWLASTFRELVERYDIDAIHLDFVRYPQGGFPEGGGRAQTVAERRTSVDALVEETARLVRQARSHVLIGAAPIGAYRNDGRWRAFHGLSDAFQDSRRWLNEGWLDYHVPQTYYGFPGLPPAGETGRPDYPTILREWVAEGGQRPVFAGLGPYLITEGHFPASFIPGWFAEGRAAGADGFFIFRLTHLLEFGEEISRQFAEKTLPVLYPGAIPPPAPLVMSMPASGGRHLEWTFSPVQSIDPVRGFLVIHAPAGQSPTIVEILDADTRSYTLPRGARISEFALATISRRGAVSNVVRVR
jgi:uncharacterized lipoprotein YddW (UPF0748 family)